LLKAPGAIPVFRGRIHVQLIEAIDEDIDRTAVRAISTINTTAIPMIFRRIDRLSMF
jgi:hypothetical protein